MFVGGSGNRGTLHTWQGPFRYRTTGQSGSHVQLNRNPRITIKVRNERSCCECVASRAVSKVHDLVNTFRPSNHRLLISTEHPQSKTIKEKWVPNTVKCSKSDCGRENRSRMEKCVRLCIHIVRTFLLTSATLEPRPSSHKE